MGLTTLGRLLDHPVLPREEQAELCRLARAGDAAARERLASASARLVLFVARRHEGKGLPLDDLVGHGCRGLLRAIDLFDPGAGASFGTYAAHWIRQAIGRAITYEAGAIRVPAHLVPRLDGGDTRPPGTAGGRARREALARLADAARRVVSLEATGDDEGDLPPARTLPDPRPGPAEAAADREARALVAGLLERLGRGHPREAAALRLRYGIGGPEMTLAEAGREMGVSKEYVRRLAFRGLDRLRKEVAEEAVA